MLLPQMLRARQRTQVNPATSIQGDISCPTVQEKNPCYPRTVLSKLGCEALTHMYLAQGIGWVEGGKLQVQINSIVSHPEPFAGPACYLAHCLMVLSYVITPGELGERLHGWDLHLLRLDLLPEITDYVIASYGDR